MHHLVVIRSSFFLETGMRVCILLVFCIKWDVSFTKLINIDKRADKTSLSTNPEIQSDSWNTGAMDLLLVQQ